jgi:hypothetical protein
LQGNSACLLLGPYRTWAALFDHLVCERDQARGNAYTKRLSRFKIDYELQFSRLNDREITRLNFKAEPQPPVRKLLYRRGGLSHRLSHTLSHSLSHMTNDPLSRPIVPPARERHRQAFSEDDKRRIVEEAPQPGASLSAVARSYG